MTKLSVLVVGGGIFGLWQAFELARRGHQRHLARGHARTADRRRQPLRRRDARPRLRGGGRGAHHPRAWLPGPQTVARGLSRGGGGGHARCRGAARSSRPRPFRPADARARAGRRRTHRGARTRACRPLRARAFTSRTKRICAAARARFPGERAAPHGRGRCISTAPWPARFGLPQARAKPSSIAAALARRASSRTCAACAARWRS